MTKRISSRINVVLPEDTVRSIDRITKPGERSRFISRAVDHSIATQSAEAVRQRLETALRRDSDLDQAVTDEWSGVDQESWREPEQHENPRKPVTPDGEKSTSRRSIRR